MRTNHWRRKVHRRANHEGARIWAKSYTTLSLGALIVRHKSGSLTGLARQKWNGDIGKRQKARQRNNCDSNPGVRQTR
jgi:hypothetical protein